MTAGGLRFCGRVVPHYLEQAERALRGQADHVGPRRLPAGEYDLPGKQAGGLQRLGGRQRRARPMGLQVCAQLLAHKPHAPSPTLSEERRGHLSLASRFLHIKCARSYSTTLSQTAEDRRARDSGLLRAYLQSLTAPGDDDTPELEFEEARQDVALLRVVLWFISAVVSVRPGPHPRPAPPLPPPPARPIGAECAGA